MTPTSVAVIPATHNAVITVLIAGDISATNSGFPSRVQPLVYYILPNCGCDKAADIFAFGDLAADFSCAHIVRLDRQDARIELFGGLFAEIPGKLLD